MFSWQKIKKYSCSISPHDVLAGLTSSLYTLAYIVVSSALIFKNNLEIYYPLGIFTAFIGVFITNIIILSRSNFIYAITFPLPALTIILAIIATRIASESTFTNLYPTFLIMIMLGSIIPGLVLYIVGKARLTYMLRFIPYPVIGGFYAGAGCLLSRAAFSLVNQEKIVTTTKYIHVMTWSSHYLPILIIGIVLFALTKLIKKPYIAGFVIILSSVMTYIAFWALHLTHATAVQNGWVYDPVNFSYLMDKIWNKNFIEWVDWGIILKQYSYFLSLIILTLVMQLVSANALEIANQTANIDKADLAYEIKLQGVANTISGILGGMISIPSLTGSLLNFRSGAKTRAAGIFMGIFCIIILFVATSIINNIPKIIVSGLFIFISLNLFYQWLYLTWRQLSHIEYSIIIAITLAINFLGIVDGVVLGILLSCFKFIIEYSHTEIIKNIIDGSLFLSKHKYDLPKETALKELGKNVFLIELQGHLFFGSTTTIVEKMISLILQQEQSNQNIKFLIIDFQRVTGIDSSSSLSFLQMKRITANHEIQLIFSHLSAHILNQMENLDVISTSDTLKLFKNKDLAMEWCETELLKQNKNVLISAEQRFAGLIFTKEEKQILQQYLIKKELPSDFTLFKQGDSGDCLCLIETGKVTAYRQHENNEHTRLYTSEAGTIIGEMAFYLQSTRFATVITDEPCIIYILTNSAFEKLQKENSEVALKLYHNIVSILAERLARADAELTLLSRG